MKRFWPRLAAAPGGGAGLDGGEDPLAASSSSPPAGSAVERLAGASYSSPPAGSSSVSPVRTGGFDRDASAGTPTLAELRALKARQRATPPPVGEVVDLDDLREGGNAWYNISPTVREALLILTQHLQAQAPALERLERLPGLVSVMEDRFVQVDQNLNRLQVQLSNSVREEAAARAERRALAERLLRLEQAAAAAARRTGATSSGTAAAAEVHALGERVEERLARLEQQVGRKLDTAELEDYNRQVTRAFENAATFNGETTVSQLQFHAERLNEEIVNIAASKAEAAEVEALRQRVQELDRAAQVPAAPRPGAAAADDELRAVGAGLKALGGELHDGLREFRHKLQAVSDRVRDAEARQDRAAAGGEAAKEVARVEGRMKELQGALQGLKGDVQNVMGSLYGPPGPAANPIVETPGSPFPTTSSLFAGSPAPQTPQGPSPGPGGYAVGFAARGGAVLQQMALQHQRMEVMAQTLDEQRRRFEEADKLDAKLDVRDQLKAQEEELKVLKRGLDEIKKATYKRVDDHAGAIAKLSRGIQNNLNDRPTVPYVKNLMRNAISEERVHYNDQLAAVKEEVTNIEISVHRLIKKRFAALDLGDLPRAAGRPSPQPVPVPAPAPAPAPHAAPQVVQVTPPQPPQPQVIHVQAPQQPIREIRYVDATPARTIEQDEEIEALLANQRKETQRNNVKLMEHSRILAGLERQNSEGIGTLRQLMGNIEEMQRTVQDTKNRIVLVDNSVRNFDPRMSSLEGEINRSKADLAKYFHEFHDVNRRVQGQLREMRTDVDGRPTSSQPNVELVEAICKRVVTTTVESKAAQDRTVLAEQIETSLASRMSASETEAMIEAKIVQHLNEKETMNDEVVFIQNLVHKLCKDEFSTFNESSSVEFYMDRIMGRVEAFEKVIRGIPSRSEVEILQSEIAAKIDAEQLQALERKLNTTFQTALAKKLDVKSYLNPQSQGTLTPSRDDIQNVRARYEMRRQMR